jgi:hypothetical protein
LVFIFARYLLLFSLGVSYKNESQKNGSHHNIQSSSNFSKVGQPLEKLPPFSLNPSDLDFDDDVQRVYIDEFKDVGDGKLFKGQWNKKTGERDGVGI